MKPVFVTGATGFVGRQFIAEMVADQRPVIGLHRDSTAGPSPNPHVTLITGDLLSPASYSAALLEADTVVHLAATTGKATPEEHQRTNVEGTRVLLREARDRGVRNFLYVSSIAARFEESRYHYARTKREAEAIVREGGVNFTILRPTIVVGPGSPVVEGLRKIATLPVLVIPGDGKALVQPVFVRDLTGFMSEMVGKGLFDCETIEVGGPDVMAIEELLLAIRGHEKGRGGAALHLPLAPLMVFLSLLEPLAFNWLPVTSGQLSSFGWDGTARPHPLLAERLSGFRTFDQVLRDEPRR